jgi:cytochrome P450
MRVLGQDIAADQPLVISIVGIHHDPHLYPEPDHFLPERFLQRNYGIFEFLPFGGGHRRCLGAGLAEYTMRIALAEIAAHWDFEPAGIDDDTRLNVAMGPRKGIPVRIKERKNNS